MVSYIAEKPYPSMGDNSKKSRNCCPHPFSHRSATPSTVATGWPLSRGLWDQNPHPTLSRSTATPRLWSGLLWSGEGGGSDRFLMLFCAARVLFTSELIHCLPQPGSQQGVDEEGSFKQRQAMVGLVRIQQAPAEW